MADFFVNHRKWIALAILACGAMAAWWSSHDAPRGASSVLSGEPLAWQDAPLEPAVSQPTWAVPSAIVGQIPAPAVAAPYAAHNPLEAPFPSDDGQRPPPLDTNYPSAAPPAPSQTFRPEATRRAKLPELDEAAAPGQSSSTHRVCDGDTLASLAERYLGDSALAPALFEANRDRLRDAEVLPIGLELRIPQVAAPASPPAALPPTAWPPTEASIAAPSTVEAPIASPPLAAFDAGAAMATIAPGALRRDVPSATSHTIAATPAPVAIGRGGRTHVVRRGDTLRAIARNYYGDAGRWTEIFKANQPRLADPNRLQVGAELIVP